MPQTKADRQAAAKKGAATRERNKKRAQSRTGGHEGRCHACEQRGIRQRQAGKAVGGRRDHIGGVPRSATAVSAGKSVATRARGGKKG